MNHNVREYILSNIEYFKKVCQPYNCLSAVVRHCSPQETYTSIQIYYRTNSTCETEEL